MMRRYGSANSLNALHTPQRFLMTPIGDATPMKSLRRSAMMSTDRGRRENHENCLRIMDVLQRDGNFFTQLNLVAGLKSMTARQFLQIITYFMQMIGGKTATTNKAFQADPLSGILTFLKSINCPYMVTKSAMKTPNAPHTFDQLVTLMLWLAEFAGDDDNESMPDDGFLRDDELPNQVMTATFSREMKTGFGLWNKQSDDEFRQLQDRIVDAFIMAKTNGNVKSVVELNSATDASKQRIQQLSKMPSGLANEQEFEAMQSQYLKYEEIEHNLKQKILLSSDHMAAIELKWKDRDDDVQRRKTHINTMQTKIDSQSKNVTEFKQLLEKLSLLLVSIDELKAEIETIQGINKTNEIRSARLLKEKSNAIAKCNVHMMRVCQLVNRCNVNIDVNPNELSLNCQSSLATVKSIRDKIHEIFVAVANRRTVIDIELNNLINEVDALRQQEKNASDRLQMHRTEMEKIMQQLTKIKRKKLSMEETRARTCAELEKQLQQGQSDLRSADEIVVELNKKILAMRQQNEELMNSCEAKAMEMIQQKQEIINRLDESIALVDQCSARLGTVDPNEKRNELP